MTIMEIIVDTYEHFTYHARQITFAVKSRKNVDIGYNKGVDLNKTS